MQNKQAFTLTELLVVVLIIGILTAVVVPQYKIAIVKSRVMQAIPYVKALHDAQEIYYLANGTYAAQEQMLDIQSGECPQNWVCSCSQEAIRAKLYENNSLILTLVYSLDHRSDGLSKRAGKLYCYSKTTSETGMRVCKTFGTEFSRSSAEVLYALN